MAGGFTSLLIGSFIYFSCVSSSEIDDSIALSIVYPQLSSGRVAVKASKLLNVDIQIELFHGEHATALRKEPHLWELCYQASLDVKSSYSESKSITSTSATLPLLKSDQVCLSIVEGAGRPFPSLQLPDGTGNIAGVIEHWKLNTWIQSIKDVNTVIARSHSHFLLHAAIEDDQLGSSLHITNTDTKSYTSSFGGYRVTNESIIAELQVLLFDPETGRIAVPEGSRVWIEAGANSRNTLASVEGQCPGNEDVFVISFEPLMNQYCRLTGSNSGDSSTKLGSAPKGIALPFAVGTRDGEVSHFYVSEVDGCSSLLESNQGKEGNEECLYLSETRTVPIMSLEKLIDLLPDNLQVDFVKIDVQGVGLDVIASAGKHLNRIDSVLLDVLLDTSTPLYKGQNTCKQSLHKLAEWGFHISETADEDICEFASKNKVRLVGEASLQDEVNLFAARDPLKWRPVCRTKSDSAYSLREVEDLFMINAPNQVRMCDADICRREGASSLACSDDGACQYATMDIPVYREAGMTQSSICFCDV